MASLSDFLGGDTLANAGNILGQGMARRGGLLGLPLGALIGGASQNALQQRQQGIQNTLANQIRSYAAQSKDPSEQAQLHMAADMAAAGGDPSSLLHIAKTAANKPTFFKSLSKAGELQGAWSPETGQFVPYNGPAGYTAVPKEQNPTSPFTANYQSYLLTHPGDEAGAAAFAQQKDLATAMQLKQAGERPDFGRVQLGDKIYTYNTHDPSSMQLLGNAPPTAADRPSYTVHNINGKEVAVDSRNPTNQKVLGNAPPKLPTDPLAEYKDRLAGIPKSIKENYIAAPSADVPGGVVLHPNAGTTEPGTGYVGDRFGGAPAKSKLMLPDGRMIKAGQKVRLPNGKTVVWTP